MLRIYNRLILFVNKEVLMNIDIIIDVIQVVLSAIMVVLLWKIRKKYK